MAQPKQFKMKSRPTEPKREVYYSRLEVSSRETTLEEILEKLPKGIEPGRVVIRANRDYGYGCDDVSCDLEVTYPALEDESAFAERMAKYKEKLAAWQRWYAKNEPAIKDREAAEKERKKKECQKAKELHQRELVRRKANLEKELQRVEKNLKKREA